MVSKRVLYLCKAVLTSDFGKLTSPSYSKSLWFLLVFWSYVLSLCFQFCMITNVFFFHHIGFLNLGKIRFSQQVMIDIAIKSAVVESRMGPSAHVGESYWDLFQAWGKIYHNTSLQVRVLIRFTKRLRCLCNALYCPWWYRSRARKVIDGYKARSELLPVLDKMLITILVSNRNSNLSSKESSSAKAVAFGCHGDSSLTIGFLSFNWHHFCFGATCVY